MNRVVGALNKVQKEQVEAFSESRNRLKGKIMRINSDYMGGVIYKSIKGIRKEIYFNKSAFVSNTNFSKARVGSIVSFELMLDDIGRTIAKNIKVEGHMYDDITKMFRLPSGQTINCNSVMRYGIGDATKEIMRKLNCTYSFIKDNGYIDNDLKYIYISTVNHNYRIYKKDFPIKMENMVDDLDEYLKYLDTVLVGIDSNSLNREPRKFKTRKVDKIWAVVVDDTIIYRVGDVIECLRDYMTNKDLDGCKIINIESSKFEVEYCGTKYMLYTKHLK